MLAFAEGIYSIHIESIIQKGVRQKKCNLTVWQLLGLEKFFPERAFGKLRKVLAFAEGVVKVWAFAEGAVKKVFASLEMCWHWLKDLFKMYRLINLIFFRDLVFQEVITCHIDDDIKSFLHRFPPDSIRI